MEIYYSRKFYLAFIVCKKNFSKIEKKEKCEQNWKQNWFLSATGPVSNEEDATTMADTISGPGLQAVWQ